MSRLHRALMLAATLVVLALVLGLAVPVFAVTPEYVPDEVIVKFKSSTPRSERELLKRELNATEVKKSLFGGFSVLRVKNSDGRRMANIIRRRAQVAWAEPNHIARKFAMPNDPMLSRQWNFYNSVYGGINVPGAWAMTMGSPAIIVAVLDTGVAYENYDSNSDGKLEYLQAPDLAGTRFVAGYDFANNDTHANDDDGHGTHVTGTIAQTTNNSLGCAGVAPGVSIMPVKVLGGTGDGAYSDIADGIYFATNAGAKVINMSLGGYFDDQVLHEACNYAYQHGVTIVAAAGNESLPFMGYPAGYSTVISVGATDYRNQRTWYSNYGPGLTIMAPGGDTGVDLNGDGQKDGILQQTYPGADVDEPDLTKFAYLYMQGTSMASPHVAGVAALIASMGITDPDEVREIIQSTALNLSTPGYDQNTGWGLVSAQSAVLQATANDPGPVANAGADQSVTDLDGDGMEMVMLDATGSLAAPGFPIVSYEWRKGGVLIGYGSVANIRLGVGTNYLTLRCTDSIGKTSMDTVAVSVKPGPPILRVRSINLFSKTVSGRPTVYATVTITNGTYQPMSRATVYGVWSGTVNRTARQLTTNSQGQVSFSAGTMNTGSYTFTVTRAVKSGYTYRPQYNVVTSASRTFYR